MRQHQYGDISNLNAPYDDMSLQGTDGILGGGDSLGFNMAEEHSIPWMGSQSHPAVAQAQAEVNKKLRADGYKELLTDGILGPRTCGALEDYDMGGLIYNACDEHKAKGFMYPEKMQWGVPMRDPEMEAAAQQQTLARSGGGGVPSWVWGILVAGGAVGVAIYLKKRKKRG